MRPPIGKPSRAASGQAQTRGRLSVPAVAGWVVVCDKEVMCPFLFDGLAFALQPAHG